MRRLKNNIIDIITFLYSLVIIIINTALIVGVYNNYFDGLYLVGVIILIHLLVISIYVVYNELKEIRFN
jgi:hypothetical protein